jgi:hypothetical protein
MITNSGGLIFANDSMLTILYKYMGNNKEEKW